jgi:hypothetical protein
MSLPQACVPPGYHFRDVQLEMSPKPFWNTTPELREAVCREIFLQWLPLCRHADSISIQLWTGDGSEILEYQGDLDATFDWARYHGAANHFIKRHADAPDNGDTDHNAIGLYPPSRDPDKRGVHMRSYLYRPEPAVFTYRWLKDLIATLKQVGREITGKKILVGTAFDIGPEFAVSKFKYEWHREICGGSALFGGTFIRCDAKLKGDTRKYAGFPGGIPEDTAMGAFLGRQVRHYVRDCPFDFLWLSNGFGFALEPWALTGAIFNGSTFSADKAPETGRNILEFWRSFRSECPALHIRTRGTNLCTGIDLGSDASPVRDIYREVPHLDAPVNSPWAALDGDIGLELAGWMSHMAKRPGDGYRYRYYIHDAWWMNSPWLDRYQRQPFDIYLPLSVSRLQADGTVEPPSDIAFLSIDDSHGNMPVVVPTEVIPHILHAREFFPDAPGPVVWIYPFEEYHDLVLGAEPTPDLPFFGDWFARGLITQSMPLNTVANSTEARTLLATQPEKLKGAILIAPVLPERCGLTEFLVKYAQSGGRVLFYGPLDQSPILREQLGIELAGPLEGDFEFAPAGRSSRMLRHLPFLSAGPWREVSKPGISNLEFHASQGGETRSAATLKNTADGGQIGWVRGSLATAEFDPNNPKPIKGPRLAALDPKLFASSEDLGRTLLEEMGLTVDWREKAGERLPILTIHRNRNAFIFSGYQPNASDAVRLGLEIGAPLFPAMQNRVENGTTLYSGPASWHHVSRAFVVESGQATVTCRILPPVQQGYTLRLLLSGLKNATVRFFPEPGTEKALEILLQPKFPYFVGDFVKPVFEESSHGRHVTVHHVGGEILFSW